MILKSILKNILLKIPQIKRIIDEKKRLISENEYLKQKIVKLMKLEKYYDFEKLKNKKGPVVLVSRPIAYTFPLSYAYLAGYLKENGEDVRVLFKYGDNKKLVKEIMSLNPILVGFGNLYPELQEICSIIEMLNEEGRDFPIVVGGQMFSPIPEFGLKITGADFGAIGEAEIILYQLVKALRENKDVTKIGGLAIRNYNTVTVNEHGEYIEDLSKLPKIPYEMFPTEEWLNVGRWYTRNIPEQPHWRFNDRVINVHGGRGCPFKCNFCYHHNKPRYRDINIMMDEAEMAIEKFDANMLYFSDDLVITNQKRIKELISRIKSLKKQISYSVSTRFDILERLDDNILRELKETGCRIMGIGIESGSDRILKIIGKNTTAEKILKELDRLKDAGILPTGNIMVGQYTETKEDVLMSFDLMRRSVKSNPLIQYACSITTPFPGSELYDLIFKKGLLKDDEEFYNKYFNEYKFGDWSQVVNLSAMSDEEVVFYRDEFEKIYQEEKTKAFGKDKWSKILKICEAQKKLAKENENENFKNNNDYEKKQLKLEEEKLNLMGIKC